MGDPKELRDVQSLLKEKGKDYGDAWKVANSMLSVLPVPSLIPLINAGYFHAWFQILSKLSRAITSPHKLDHWKDIAGWATLVANDIEANKPRDPFREGEKGI